MFLYSYPQIKRFLHCFIVEETIFHWACNNFCHKLLKIDDEYFKNEDNLKGLHMIMKGQILAKYQKIKFNPNSHNSDFKDIRLFNKANDNDEKIEIYLKKGDLFSKKLKIRGYTISSIHLLEDTDVLFLDNLIYHRIFEKSFAKVEKEKKLFIINLIETFRNMPAYRLNIFLDQTITNVNYIFICLI